MVKDVNERPLKQFIVASVLWAFCYAAVYAVIFYPIDLDWMYIPHEVQILGISIVAFLALVMSVYSGLKVLRWR